MATGTDKLLSKVLIDQGLIDQGQLNSLAKDVKEPGKPLYRVILEGGIVAEEKLLEALAQELKLSFIDLKDRSIDKSIMEKVPLKFATYYKFMPLNIADRVMTIAVAYPLDTKVQDEIRTHLGYEIDMVLAVSSDINDALKDYYGLAAATIDKIIAKTPKTQMAESRAEAEIEDIEKLAEEESVTKLVNQIILEAYKRRATDIHIEPYRGKVRLRYRIDGVLHDAPVPPEITHFYSSILSRMKIMSNLNIIERRLPQDRVPIQYQ